MKDKLLTVEDAVQVTRIGLIVIPGPLDEAFPGPAEIDVELRRPDGSRQDAVLSIRHVFQSPPPKVRRWTCIFKDLRTEDVPVGTEIWRDV